MRTAKKYALILIALIMTAGICFAGITAFADSVSGDFSYTESGDGVTITEYTGAGGNLELPDKIAGKPVTGIGASAFNGCTGLLSVTIPGGITSVGKNAFSGCDRLESVTIPGSLESISEGMFSGCSSLTRVTIPDGVQSISAKAFNGCESLSDVKIPGSVRSIGVNSFSGCTSLSYITVPDGVGSVADRAFASCGNLKTAWVSDGCTVGENSFDSAVNVIRYGIRGNASLVYNGKNRYNEFLTGITLTKDGVSLVNGNDFRAYFSDDNGLTWKTSCIDAGLYRVRLAGLRNNAGEVADENMTVSIVPAEITVTIKGKTGTSPYDGSEHSVSGYSISISDSLYNSQYFTYSGTARASRTDAGISYMGLTGEQFINTNSNFSVTFNVTDGFQKITPINETVTVKGNIEEIDYDGLEHIVSGYTANASGSLYDVSKDFTFGGAAQASRTDAGTSYMGLTAAQFTNTNPNFDKVTFNVTDGYIKITPVIIFKNDDGTVLSRMAVLYGEMPEYTGGTPVKDDGDGYSYEFKGWNPEIVPATEAAVYTAEYTKTPIEYTARFINENGETVKETFFTVETDKIEEPPVPEKEGFTGEWESYTLGAYDIEIKAVYAKISPDPDVPSDPAATESDPDNPEVSTNSDAATETDPSESGDSEPSTNSDAATETDPPEDEEDSGFLSRLASMIKRFFRKIFSLFVIAC